MTDIQITQASAEIDGLHVEWLEAGSGPVAICLHGFPDSAHTWRPLLTDLAAAGYRAVAPWTRGYAPTGIPADGLYQAGRRARDACLLHEMLSGDGEGVLIGHDFGSGAANIAASMEPDRWSKVVMMSVPPYGRMAAAFFDYAQIRRSSYMFFFQHPLSEMVVPHDDWAFIRGLWHDWSPGLSEVAAAPHIAHFVESAAGEGRLDAILGYYRATFQPDRRSPDYEHWEAAGQTPPPQPTLYLHGSDDGCISAEHAADLVDELAPGSRVEIFDGLGHFLHAEDPARVNGAIVEFVAS